MKKDGILCVLITVLCSEEEWKNIQETVEEPKIYLIDMLEQWSKEGYHRVNKKKEKKKNYQYETERKGKKRNNT